MSDKLTIFNVVGPSAGHRSLNSFAERGSRRQVVGSEVETSLNNISKEIFSKVLRGNSNRESTEGCFPINVVKEINKSFILKGAQLTDWGFGVSLTTKSKRNLGLCFFNVY